MTFNWRPITEKPEKDGWYLVWFTKGLYKWNWNRDFYSTASGWSFLGDEDATHWCKVEPPE